MPDTDIRRRAHRACATSAPPRLAALLIAVGLAACTMRPSAPQPGSVTLDPDARVTLQAVPLSPARPPARNLDLRQWKLTIPSGEDIQVAELNEGYTLGGAFFSDPETGGIVFRVPNRAGTTKNSTYSRTELRQMRMPTESAKADANNWTMEEGGTLRARLRVDRVSTTGEEDKVGRIVIGQIHGDDSEPIRLYFHKRPDEAKGRIYAGIDSAENKNSWSPDIIGNDDGRGIALGEIFEYEIRLHGRRLTVTIEPPAGTATVFTQDIDADYAGENLYFKAGVYNQNNTGDAQDYAQATFFALEQTHP